MPYDPAALIGAALAGLWLLGVVTADLAVSRPTLVLTSLFGLAPLIGCAVLRASTTSMFAVAATALAITSGWWDHSWGMAQQYVRIADVVLVSAAAVAISAVRVRREQRFARVAAIAEVAQRAMLPTLPKRVGPVTVAVRYVSAARDAVVGGDLYDWYLSESMVRFLVGDVRGKGLGAVEHAARVIRAFRQAAARESTLSATAVDMGAYLEQFFGDEEFVTALLVEASDPGHLTLVSCGHPPPILLRADGSAELLEAPPGLPLGLGGTFEPITVSWAPGDRLLMYTDGLSEARNAEGEFFPLPPRAPLLRTAPVEAELDGLLAAVVEHVPGGELGDDLAVMLLENSPVPQQSASVELGRADEPVPSVAWNTAVTVDTLR